MQFLDKYGFPVERIRGRRFINIIRLLLWTRRIKRGKWKDKVYRDKDGPMSPGPAKEKTP